MTVNYLAFGVLIEMMQVVCEGHDVEPRNSFKKEFDGRIEINLDWFESEEIAKNFRDGKVTYVHTYDAYYKAEIKSTLRRFRSREIVAVDPSNGFLPHRGVYKSVMLDYEPHWGGR